MSRIEDIDTTRPVGFYGSKTTISDDQFLVNIVKETGLENFYYVSSPVTATTELSIEEGRLLLDYLKTCCWREDFDRNLQCISQTEAGEALLTGWMPVETFNDFVKTTSQDGFPVQEVSVKLAEIIQGWAECGVQEATFVGYRSAA